MDPVTMSLLASAGSGLVTKLMNPGSGYNAGQKKLDQGYNAAQGYMQPYNQQGQEAYGNLSGAMNDLMDPSSLMDRWMNDYQQSEQSKIAQARAMEQGNRAASASGVMGSTPALQAMQAGASEIGAQDEQRYIERMIQQYLQGAGIAQNIYGTGANAAGQMGQNAMNYGNQSADLAYGAKAAPGQMFSNLLGTAANVGSAYMGANAMNNMANAWKTSGGGNNSALPAYMGGNGYSAGGF